MCTMYTVHLLRSTFNVFCIYIKNNKLFILFIYDLKPPKAKYSIYYFIHIIVQYNNVQNKIKSTKTMLNVNKQKLQ